MLKADLQVVGKLPYLPPGGFWKHLYWLLSSCTPQRLTSWSNCTAGEDSQGLNDWNMAQVCLRLVVRKICVFAILVFNGQKEKPLHNSINTLFDCLSYMISGKMTSCKEHHLHFVYKNSVWNRLYPMTHFFFFQIIGNSTRTNPKPLKASFCSMKTTITLTVV